MTTTELIPHRTLAPQQLLARIDVALELGAGTPEQSVALAWRSAVRDQPELVPLLLDETEPVDPALRSSRRTLLASVAVAAGLASFDTPRATAAAAGAALLRRVEAEPAPESPSRVAGLLRRLWDGGPQDPWPWAA